MHIGHPLPRTLIQARVSGKVQLEQQGLTGLSKCPDVTGDARIMVKPMLNRHLHLLGGALAA
jgi:hypothetical protein